MYGFDAPRSPHIVGDSAILVGLMTYSVEPMTQYSIDEVMDSVDQHENERIHIRGIIVNGTLNLESGTVMLTGSN